MLRKKAIKTCAAKGLQTKESCASAGFEPVLVTTTTSGRSELFTPWFCNAEFFTYTIFFNGLNESSQKPAVNFVK